MNVNINENEIKRIEKYLENPINTGLWESTFQIKSNLENQESLVKYYVEKHNVTKKHTYNNFQEREYYSKPYQVLNDIVGTSRDFAQDAILLQKFKQEVSKIRENLRIENGFFISSKGIFFIKKFPNYSIDRTFTVLSLNEEVITFLEKTFNDIGYASLQQRIKIRSEEDIYYPYFFYTNFYIYNLLDNRSYIFLNQKEENYFRESIKLHFHLLEELNQPSDPLNPNYKVHSYESCMIQIGHAVEVKLREVYTYLFHKETTNIQSLGGLLSEIEKEVKSILRSNNSSLGNTTSKKGFTKIFDLCRELSQETLSDNEKKIVSALRIIAKEIEKGDKSNKQNINQKENSVLFPKTIYTSIELLKNYRNKVAHPNKPLTHLESTKMLFSYITVSLWWQEMCQKIDNWDISSEEIVKKFVEFKQYEDK
ncbi:hypothetical protein KKC13_10065 [bacterium]|nr:hypothetical protein [bacterium]MBU1958348.1 hypothetical protein [bacterium]